MMVILPETVLMMIMIMILVMMTMMMVIWGLFGSF